MAEVEGKSNNNSMMMVLVGLVIVLILAMGGIGYFMYSKGYFTDQTVNTVTSGANQTPGTPKQDFGKIYLSPINSLVLNITDAKGRAKLMKLSFTLKTNESSIEALVEANKAEIVDSVIRQVSARSSEELLTVGGKAMLKEEMIQELNNILNDAADKDDNVVRNMVIDIFFTSFVIK